MNNKKESQDQVRTSVSRKDLLAGLTEDQIKKVALYSGFYLMILSDTSVEMELNTALIAALVFCKTVRLSSTSA